MHEDPRVAGRDAMGHALVGDGRGQGEIAAGHGLADGHDVGTDPGLVAGEQGPGASEAGGDLVGDQQDVVTVAQGPDLPQVVRRVETHPPGPLDDGLEDHRRQFVAMACDQVGEFGDVVGLAGLAEAAGRGRGKDLLRQGRGPQAVHPGIRVADGHGVEGVPVVAAADGHEAVTLGTPPGLPVLDGHLDGHLHRDRPRVAQEAVAQRFRGQVHQVPDQARGRFMGQAPEHHVGHGVELLKHGLIQDRVVVAMDGAPPGGHAVDQLASVHQVQPAPLGGTYRIDRVTVQGRGVGVPGMGLVDGEDLVDVHGEKLKQRATRGPQSGWEAFPRRACSVPTQSVGTRRDTSGVYQPRFSRGI